MSRADTRRRLERLGERMSGSPLAMPGLFALSFLETTVLPVAIELVLVPWMLLDRPRLWRIATVALLGCLTAALAGYAVGALLFDTLGQWLLASYGHADAYERFVAYFQRYGFWAVLAIGVLPIPFQAAMLAAGATGYPLPLFVLATVMARGVRYYGLALLAAWFGPLALSVWHRYGNRALAAGLLALVAVALVVRWISGL